MAVLHILMEFFHVLQVAAAANNYCGVVNWHLGWQKEMDSILYYPFTTLIAS